MKQPKACVLGGTGFVGRHLIARLGHDHIRCLVPSRRPHRHRELQLYPNAELRTVAALDTATLTEQFAGCDYVVNLVGILNEDAGTRFQDLHVDLVGRVLAAMTAVGVPRLLHMSALHADAKRGGSAYLRSKGAGEAMALAAHGPALAVTSFRPSVIFGPDDNLFNRFARLLDLAPGVLPLACPDARFAPVYVGDVVTAMAQAMQRPETAGRAYDLCGPRQMTLEDLVSYTARCQRRRLLLARLNDRFSRWQARVFERLPGKPFTMDNYLSLQTPSVCGEHNGLLELGIHPTDVDAVVPGYLC